MATFHVNDAISAAFAVSVAVTVAVKVPAVVAVPDTVPVLLLMLNPVGSPLADHVYGVLPPRAAIVRLAAAPVAVPFVPGFVTTTPVLQEKDTLLVSFALSVTFTVAVTVAATVGVPEMTPDVALIDKPAGRLVADHVYGVVPPEADIVNAAATLLGLICAPGFATAGEAAACAGVTVSRLAARASTHARIKDRCRSSGVLAICRG
ncbi:hypothetical protein Ato02nite_089480 [Paractinoplanes toevensis]|uniref:Uncharacterized protein n=1 Tax=Paractinoplanes toevensis TaxID=571911 RepID=A0A920BQJ2_9ACTN|nr:hypothetical protein Ato02nite_089480 [Actinoplanes toevensis]